MRRAADARCLLAQLSRLLAEPAATSRTAGMHALRDRRAASASSAATSQPWWHASRGPDGAFMPYTPYPIACAGAPRGAAATRTQPPAAASFAQPPPPPRVPPAAPPAAARVLDGRAFAAAWCADIAAEVAARSAAGPASRAPGLAVILVGDCVDSLLYVRNKRDAAAAAGIAFRLVHLPEDVTQPALLAAVRSAVEDDGVHGVLVQLPLPPHLDEERVLEAVSPAKDVDGFHPLNAGRLSMRGRTPLFVPCTPKGCLELLRRARIEVEGKAAVVLGNSNTVGTPLSLLLRECGAATVTVCHAAATCAAGGDAEARLAAVARTADILVAAVGRPGLVRGSWVKPGAVVIDVGINPVPAPGAGAGGPASRGAGFGSHVSLADLGAQEWRVVGDVAAEEVVAVAGALTPVPGGVGPMTIAALLDNVVHAWTRAEAELAARSTL